MIQLSEDSNGNCVNIGRKTINFSSGFVTVLGASSTSNYVGSKQAIFHQNSQRVIWTMAEIEQTIKTKISISQG